MDELIRASINIEIMRRVVVAAAGSNSLRMNIKNSIRKRFDRWSKVEFDKETGFYRYRRFGFYVYVRHPKHISNEENLVWSCENLFFKHYMPGGNDVVVDLGAGYGDEALYVAMHSPDVRYIGVEAQPIIYECLANTFRMPGDGFVASPYVITEATDVKFASQFEYASVGKVPKGYIEIPTMRWADFIQRYGLDHIDLLKMNIEGAERDLLLSIDDFSIVKRFAISCHDFRADHGDGEFFRTRKDVMKVLEDNNYDIKQFSYGRDYADDWIYAEHRP